MSAPESDKAGVRQIVRGLRQAGYVVTSVEDEAHDFAEGEAIRTEDQIVAELMTCDLGWLHVEKGDDHGYVFFVYGNDPEEVVNDYTVNLSDVVDPITDRWQS